jgi:hypothetical protein
MASEYLKVFDAPLKYLKFFGFWETSKRSLTFKVIFVVVHLFYAEAVFISSVLLFLKAERIEEYSVSLSLLPTLLGVCVRSLVFLSHKEKVAEMIELVQRIINQDSWLENQGEKLKKKLNKVRNVFKSFAVMTFVAIIGGLIKAFLNHQLSFQLWFPFDPQRSEPVFWATVLFEISQGFLCAPIINIIDNIPMILMSFAAGLMEELGERLENIEEMPKNEFNREVITTAEMKNLKELEKCIEIHLKIKNLVKKTEETFTTALFFQGLMSSIILCTAVFSISFVSRHLVRRKLALKLNNHKKTRGVNSQGSSLKY